MSIVACLGCLDVSFWAVLGAVSSNIVSVGTASGSAFLKKILVAAALKAMIAAKDAQKGALGTPNLLILRVLVMAGMILLSFAD